MATPRTIPITRVVSTEDGGSRFVDAEVALTNATSIGFLSDMEDAKGIIFRETDGRFSYLFLSWHSTLLDEVTLEWRRWSLSENLRISIPKPCNSLTRFIDLI